MQSRQVAAVQVFQGEPSGKQELLGILQAPDKGGESRGVCAHSLDASLSGDVASDGISVGSKSCGRKEETSRSFSSLSGSSLRLLQEEQCKEEKTLGPGVVGAGLGVPFIL